MYHIIGITWRLSLKILSKNTLKYLDKYIMYIRFEKIDWKEFFLSYIRNINFVVRLTKLNIEDGSILFIGVPNSNNGIIKFFKYKCFVRKMWWVSTMMLSLLKTFIIYILYFF